MIPSNTISFVNPLLEIPAQTSTLTGYFSLLLSFGYSHFQWKLSVAWFSSRTEHSSMNIASFDCSFSQRQFSLNCRCLTRVGLANQLAVYFVPVGTHPRSCCRHLFFSGENCIPKCSRILLGSSGEVSLWLLSISALIKFISLIIMLRGECPDVAAFLTDLSNAVQQCSGEEGGW